MSDLHFICEHCKQKMNCNEFDQMTDKTHGIAGDGSDICFGCAKKLGVTQWVRFGANTTEYYEGLEESEV